VAINRSAISQDHDGTDGNRKVPSMSSENRGRDVIVADNDYVIRDILRFVLEANGFTPLLAVDGLEALDLAMRTCARLVILDLRMPRLDGFTACAQISLLPGYTDVPIAILSAFDSIETREAAQRAGASAFLSKPFKPSDLLRMMAELLAEPTTAPAEASALIWQRRQELPPLLGKPSELSEGQRVLNICRR
jgi:CheY-like chemotaxis protein